MNKPWYKRWWIWVVAIVIFWLGASAVLNPKDALVPILAMILGLAVFVFMYGVLPTLANKLGTRIGQRNTERTSGDDSR